MSAIMRGVILVGHGGIPKDCAQELTTKLKRLEAQRRAAKQPPSAEEIELDTKICLASDGWATEFEHATLGNQKGESAESRNAFVYRFEGDRIAEMWMYLGMLPDVAEAHFG